jgi:histidyl-tRNA synthetase
MRYNLPMRYSIPEGTHDIIPYGNRAKGEEWVEDTAKWHWVEGVIRDLCATFGYEEIRTPTFEQTQLFRRAVGEGTDIVSKEMYDFATKGGTELTLRPEGTAPTLRAYLTHRMDIARRIAKLYYVGPIFRHEAKQRGRYRQHHQFGVEILGAKGPDVDAEVIHLAMTFFRRLGIQRLTLKVNSVGTFESRQKYVEALRQFAEPLLPRMSEDNQRRFRENALRMLDSKHERDQQLLADAPTLADYLDDESRAHFDALKGLLDDFGVDYTVDPRLVRGFDYYTKTAFEVHSPDLGAQSTLSGGGRYDRLMEELGGQVTPGIGFGLGIERALLALQAMGVATPESGGITAYLCPIGDAARKPLVLLLARLRDAGISADMDYAGRKPGAMFEDADRLRARYAVIAGDNELAEGVVKLRDMVTKAEETVPLTGAVEALTAR